MKKLWLLPLMLLSLVLPAACGESGDDPAPSGGHPGQPETPGGNEGGDPGETSLKIGITVGSRTITATMEDNAAARDFLSRLPLEVTLSDYSNAEKILSLTGADDLRGRTRLHPCTGRHHDLCPVGQCGHILQKRVEEQRPDPNRAHRRQRNRSPQHPRLA